jgi:hypothetical protein
MSGRCSPGSAGWTPDSTAPDTDTSSSASKTPGAEKCSPPAGPESPSTTTYELWVSNQRRELRSMEVAPAVTEPGGFTQTPFLVANTLKSQNGRGWSYDPEATYVPISSAADSPAKTSPLPENEQGSKETGQDCSSSSPALSTLFDPDGFSSRTFRVSSLARAVGTSEQSLERWPTSGTAWPGGFSTAVSSECRSDGGVCSSSEPALTEILQPPQDVPARYSLSARAAQGILRRAQKRGRSLPSHLSAALEAVARTTTDRQTA